MNKKILVLCNNSNGLYLFRKELISVLIKENTIFVSAPDEVEKKKLMRLGCKYIKQSFTSRGTNPLSDIELFIGYLELIKLIKPDYVITYTIKPNIYGSLVCELLNIPYAVNITGLGTAFQGKGILRKFVTIMYKFGLKKAKVVFFENCENMQLFLNEKIIRKEQACLLNGAGVNLVSFPYIPYPSDDKTTRFLFIGRVMREKGIDELFKAMRMLRKDGINCTLDVVGPYENDYESIIKEYESEGWLKSHGFQEDVRPFIKNCHCFVLPSWHEGMANTNLECAASGRPVITSNIHGCLEAVIEGKSGFLCDKQNAKRLYKAMKKFSELSVDVRAKMGRNGRMHMENEFDKRKVVNRTISKLFL